MTSETVREIQRRKRRELMELLRRQHEALTFRRQKCRHCGGGIPCGC